MRTVCWCHRTPASSAWDSSNIVNLDVRESSGLPSFEEGGSDNDGGDDYIIFDQRPNHWDLRESAGHAHRVGSDRRANIGSDTNCRSTYFIIWHPPRRFPSQALPLPHAVMACHPTPALMLPSTCHQPPSHIYPPGVLVWHTPPSSTTFASPLPFLFLRHTVSMVHNGG
jgi:hypothetical protein